MQGLLNIGCFFLDGFSSFQCQNEFLGNVTQYLYKNKKTTSNIKTLLKSFEKLTLRQMIAIIILFYYNDVSMLLASFSS